MKSIKHFLCFAKTVFFTVGFFLHTLFVIQFNNIGFHKKNKDIFYGKLKFIIFIVFMSITKGKKISLIFFNFLLGIT